MGRFVIRVERDGEERFLVWSSVVDAPITFACTADEIERVFIQDAKRQAKADAALALARARNGQYKLGDEVAVNRAGPGESRLTKDEIEEFYVRRKEEPTKESLAVYRAARKKRRTP